jgi:hypothetical protein
MATFTWVQSVAAGAKFNPLTDWQWQYSPGNGLVEIFHNADAVGMVVQVQMGADQVQQESPVSAGGTPGVLPCRLNVEPVSEKVASSEQLAINYRNTTGAAISVQGQLSMTPL